MQDAQAGALDEVIDNIIPIIETELFGQVSEEKEAHAFVGGCKEAKRLRAYATYQLLVQGITFRTHMSAVLQPVRSTSALCSQQTPCTAAQSACNPSHKWMLPYKSIARYYTWLACTYCHNGGAQERRGWSVSVSCLHLLQAM